LKSNHRGLHGTQHGSPAAPVLVTAEAVSQTLTVTTDSAGLTSSVASSTGTTWTYRYDTEHRMVSACRAASCASSGFDRVDYGYDGAGHRTRITTTTAAGGVTRLGVAYAGDIPAQDRVDGTVTRTYVADDTGRIVRFCDPDCTGSNRVEGRYPRAEVEICVYGQHSPPQLRDRVDEWAAGDLRTGGTAFPEPGWRLVARAPINGEIAEKARSLVDLVDSSVPGFAARPANVRAVLSCAIYLDCTGRTPSLQFGSELLIDIARLRLELDFDLYVVP
jgi:YD repeat-containing protein